MASVYPLIYEVAFHRSEEHLRNQNMADVSPHFLHALRVCILDWVNVNPITCLDATVFVLAVQSLLIHSLIALTNGNNITLQKDMYQKL